MDLFVISTGLSITNHAASLCMNSYPLVGDCVLKIELMKNELGTLLVCVSLIRRQLSDFFTLIEVICISSSVNCLFITFVDFSISLWAFCL